MAFKTGERVARRSNASDVGVVIDGPTERRGQKFHKVFWSSTKGTENVAEEDLRPAPEGSDPRDLFIARAFGDHTSLARMVTYTKINRPVRDTIYSYQASRTEFMPHQYKPLLKYLNSPFRRILIADEVGLGKTIEAAYILQEERARQELERVLVVCSAVLRAKWKDELYQRFGETFEIFDATAFRRTFLSTTALGPTEQRLFGIVSYETIRTRRVRALLDERPPALDLVILDEVHHCRNRETRTFGAARALVDNSDAVVFLSATPVHTGSSDLFNLMNLLLPERFDVEAAFAGLLNANRHVVRAESLVRKGTPDALAEARKELERLRCDALGRRITEDPYYHVVLDSLAAPETANNIELLVDAQEKLSGLNLLGDVLTRTRKRDVPTCSPLRRAWSVVRKMSDYEQQVYDQIINFIAKRYTEQHGSTVARFVLSGFQRQVASSLYAAVKHYQETVAPPNGEDDARESIQAWDIEESDFISDDENQEEGAGFYSLLSDPAFARLIACVSLDRLRSEDTKYRSLKETLGARGKVIVFAFYKRSLRYLEERLNQEGLRAVRIDGDVRSNPDDPEQDERVRRITQFRDDPTVKVMLSSQVGSEGLDFQFCDTIVNWDLPWNPMVVEQRIGRIDRFGQKSEKVVIHNLVSAGTIEEVILRRLYQRIRIFEESIGDLEPILGRVIRELTRDLFDPGLSPEEKEERVERSAQAVIQERSLLRTLEEKSAELIGHDEIVQQKIEKIRTLGRYLSGRELEIFVGEFLSSRFPASALHDQKGNRLQPGQAGPRYLRPCPEFRAFVSSRVVRTDQEGQRLVHLLRRERLKLAFDPSSALGSPDAEMIHAHHPLVRLIVDACADVEQNIHRANLVKAASTAVRPGLYFYGLVSVDEHGAFTGRHLRMELLHLPDILPEEDTEACERLLHDMVIDGERCEEDAPTLTEREIGDLFTWLDERVSQHVAAYRERRNQEAQVVVLRQMRALEASYQVKRERREKMLAAATAPGGNRRIIPAIEGQLRKLQGDFEYRKVELGDRKGVDVSYRIEGAGWVRVTPGKR